MTSTIYTKHPQTRGQITQPSQHTVPVGSKYGFSANGGIETEFFPGIKDHTRDVSRAIKNGGINRLKQELETTRQMIERLEKQPESPVRQNSLSALKKAKSELKLSLGYLLSPDDLNDLINPDDLARGLAETREMMEQLQLPPRIKQQIVAEQTDAQGNIRQAALECLASLHPRNYCSTTTGATIYAFLETFVNGVSSSAYPSMRLRYNGQSVSAAEQAAAQAMLSSSCLSAYGVQMLNSFNNSTGIASMSISLAAGNTTLNVDAQNVGPDFQNMVNNGVLNLSFWEYILKYCIVPSITVTLTPTQTTSLTPTGSVTVTPSGTISVSSTSPTPTTISTPSGSATITPSATPAPSANVSVTSSRTSSVSVSESPTLTISSTSLEGETTTASFTITPKSLTASRTPSASVSETASLSPSYYFPSTSPTSSSAGGAIESSSGNTDLYWEVALAVVAASALLAGGLFAARRRKRNEITPSSNNMRTFRNRTNSADQVGVTANPMFLNENLRQQALISRQQDEISRLPNAAQSRVLVPENRVEMQPSPATPPTIVVTTENLDDNGSSSSDGETQ